MGWSMACLRPKRSLIAIAHSQGGLTANCFHKCVSFSSAEEVKVNRDFVGAAYVIGDFCDGGG